MTCVFEKNGNPRLRFSTDDPIEQAFLERMGHLSENGATTILARPKSGEIGGEYVLEVKDKC